MCRDERSSWQAKEGSVMGLNVIVRRFQWVGAIEDPTEPNPDFTKAEYYLKVGVVDALVLLMPVVC